MKLLNHEPIIKIFGNGMQVTFPNQYTLLIKNGLGANCTQTTNVDDPASMLMASRFGGNSGPDVEVEIYDTKGQNITNKFSEDASMSLGFVTPLELSNLFYIVSSLK